MQIFWYILTPSTEGNFWDGPYADAVLRQAAAAGSLPGDTLLSLAADGRVLTVQDAFTTHESDWSTIGKALLFGAGVALTGIVVMEFFQYLLDTPEQRSIRLSARRHARSGADVYADHIGCEFRPPVLGGRRPDVVADYGDRLVVEEHETEESVNRRHSIEQDRDLYRWASCRPRVRYRQVVV